MTPPRPHDPPRVPPRASGRVQIVWGAPPVTPILLNLSAVKKAMNRPSGDQKGSRAPSVSENGLATTESKGRTQSCDLPLESTAVKAKLRLSGDTDTESNSHPGGCARDRKSTRLNSSHLGISYAVFCLK